MVEAYPLHWPDGVTRSKAPKRSRFQVSSRQARDSLVEAVRLCGGRGLVISSNVSLRKDGLPYANQRRPDDAGVAVYFERAGRRLVFPCDAYREVHENMRAIALHLEAMRAMERYGVSEAADRAFEGFQYLPPPGGPEPAQEGWWTVLGVDPDASEVEVHRAWKRLAAGARRAGDEDRVKALNVARDQSRRKRSA